MVDEAVRKQNNVGCSGARIGGIINDSDVRAASSFSRASPHLLRREGGVRKLRAAHLERVTCGKCRVNCWRLAGLSRPTRRLLYRVPRRHRRQQRPCSLLLPHLYLGSPPRKPHLRARICMRSASLMSNAVVVKRGVASSTIMRAGGTKFGVYGVAGAACSAEIIASSSAVPARASWRSRRPAVQVINGASALRCVSARHGMPARRRGARKRAGAAGASALRPIAISRVPHQNQQQYLRIARHVPTPAPICKASGNNHRRLASSRVSSIVSAR